MLWELHVNNLAVISDLRLEFKRGLTVLSGDEGAGKSLLVDALCLLTGGKASTALIRSGASVALVEGIFHVDTKGNDRITLLEDSGLQLEPDGTLVVSREVQEEGRSIARVNGRAVPVSLLRELGQHLVDIHSQMEHLSLLNPQRQMDLVDGYGGLLDLRAELGTILSALRQKGHELGLVSEKNCQRERDLLEYQVAEVDQANIQVVGEDEALEKEGRILQRAQELKEYCYAAHSILYADDQAATGLIHQATKALERASAIDPALQSQVEQIGATTVELEQAARDLGSYIEGIEDNPERLQHVEERSSQLRQLKHKYGGSLEEVLQFLADARQKLEAIESQDEKRRQLEEERQSLQAEAGQLAERLSCSREEAAGSLKKLINSELAELGMPWARFDIQLTREEREDGLPAYQGNYSFTQHGIDRMQFLASTNPEELPRLLADIASGGETCRFMLALKSALRQADSIPTLVFDEIDAGVGGRNASSVGSKLAALARNRQVVCITHLPQMACFGDNHYQVIKDVSSAQSLTSIEHLQGDRRVEELAAMLGGIKKPMLESAEELLASARQSEQKPARASNTREKQEATVW
jgi:DNA repair protein RecN (Recombination protein N)